jgi:hypothetical protein
MLFDGTPLARIGKTSFRYVPCRVTVSTRRRDPASFSPADRQARRGRCVLSDFRPKQQRAAQRGANSLESAIDVEHALPGAVMKFSGPDS